MVCIKEFHGKQHIYLSVTDKEIDDPRHGTCLTVYRSLRRAEGIQSSICEQNFLSEMSRKVEQENASATYVLKNTFQERPATSDLLPMLGRSIISDSVRWGSNQLRIYGDFNFIAAYHFLAKQPESKKGVSSQQWVKHWYKGEINYASDVKRRRNSNLAPKHTHNQDGVLKDRPTTWTRGCNISVLLGAKCFNCHEARELIHEGSRAEVGCTILSKNRIELLFDEGTLNLAHFDYLVSLQTGFLPLRFRDSFHIEPYTPYRFSRQFGFRQDVPSMLSRSVSNRIVTYYEALRYWTLWLFKGSRSRVYAPYVALNWHDLTTLRFQNWWSKVSISDLRDKVA
ncbi:putative elongator complex protein 2, partial [Bienertia sinuspersici]